MFKDLTKYIKAFNHIKVYGEWIFDEKNEGTREQPMQGAYLQYHRQIGSFIEDFYLFAQKQSQYELMNYQRILERNHLEWDYEVMKTADVSKRDAQYVLALIMGAIRAERFHEGLLMELMEKGILVEWLTRLQVISKNGY